jgi:uncharacterized protein (DUF58 family)
VAENGLLIDTPLLEKLERLAIQWQKSLPGAVGGHNTSRFAGAGQEFLDHRQFHHGDDLRAVDWRAYLRLEKMFLKMFQLEPRIPVRVLVDVSRSMTTGGSKTALSKFDYARKLAAAVLRHRIILNFDAHADGQTPETILSKIIPSVVAAQAGAKV